MVIEPVAPQPNRRAVLGGLGMGLAALAGAGSASGLLSACGIDDPGQELTGGAVATAPDPAALRPAVRAINGFALDLFRSQCARTGGNVAVAPPAIAASLAAARLGSAGITRGELDRLLHVADMGTPATAFVTIAALLAQRTGSRSNAIRTGHIDIRAAHGLWAPRGTPFDPAFLDRLAVELASGVHVIDFRSDAEGARAAVNRWAADTTRGAVTNLMPKGSVNEFTQMLSTSAMQFQAPWDHQFPKARTTPSSFTRVDGTTSSPPTMAMVTSGKVLTGETDDGTVVVDLPYLGNELTLAILAPPAGAIDGYVARLDTAAVEAAIQSLAPGSHEIRVPRFGFTSELRLDDALRDAGLTSAFAEEAADFTAIAADERLSLSQVVHQVYAGIDEEGSSATAATVTKADPSPTQTGRTVAVDRPFVFVVRDRSTGLLLQVGRVHDPTAA